MSALSNLIGKNRIWQLRYLLLLCLIIYGLTAGGHFSSTDEEDIYTNTALLSTLIFSPASIDQTTDGTVIERSAIEPGQSLVALPWYWLGQILTQFIYPHWHAYTERAVMTLFNLFITLCTVSVIYLWAKELSSQKTALIVAGLYGLASMAWPYSQTFYREPLTGLCLLVAFWYGSRFRKSHIRAHILFSLAAMILAIMTKTTAVFAVPWWLLLVAPEQLDRQKVGKGLAFAGVLMAAVVLILPAKMPTLQAFMQEFFFDIQQSYPAMAYYGLHGLLTSPGKGLLFAVPPILLALLGFPRFWHDHRREALAIAGLTLSFVVLYSTRRGWHGGASWGPRYLLPILPLMLLPSLSFIQLASQSSVGASRQAVVRFTIVILALMGMLVQLSAVAIFPLNYYDVKIREGAIQPDNLVGGRTYLQELYFDPAQSPVWGHAVLAIERTNHLLRFEDEDALDTLPSSADMIWRKFIAADILDFWWLHWLMMPGESVGGRSVFIFLNSDE